jgi:hypothetical protein
MEGDVAMEAGVRSVYICILKPRRRHEARRWLCVYDLDAGERGTKTAANMSSPVLRLAWEECEREKGLARKVKGDFSKRFTPKIDINSSLERNTNANLDKVCNVSDCLTRANKEWLLL